MVFCIISTNSISPIFVVFVSVLSGLLNLHLSVGIFDTDFRRLLFRLVLDAISHFLSYPYDKASSKA